MIRFLLFCTCLLASGGYALHQLHELSPRENNEEEKMKEVLYIPDGTALDVLSFGYKNVLSDILWFKTVSYFGKHYKSDQDYTWLSHMCSLITDLNPHAEHVFSFCSTMLSWEVKQPKAAHALISKAIATSPYYWRNYYLRGFISMYFLDDPNGAKEDFTLAAKLPNAPAFVARLAASKMSLSDPQAAVDFLTQMLRTTEDPNQRASLEDKLHQAKSKLEKARESSQVAQ